ncbi:DoxX family protein [Phenylobacterium montanum]|uniref:DoxX family protein n=1 Tax=Phenylobacterium montanum TaxID=2823693 RepID=A0A975IT95_9CAUL|nr:DoxX family protein [Caulobacter sp. S6]QUD86505.1 DoxX family protein [Caulobacter sp. S6]
MSLLTILGLAGRSLIALLFILAGAAKLFGPKPFLEHMRQFRVPAPLLVGVILLEIGAGGAVLAGWNLRWSAGALSAFCLVTAVVFHADLRNKVERTAFFKDLALCGGLLSMAVAG